MWRRFKAVVQSFRTRSSHVNTEPQLTSPELEPDEQVEKGVDKAAEGIGTGDEQLKMEAARCDHHPLYRLRAAVVEMAGPNTDHLLTKTESLRCTRNGCVRHYLSEHGYFEVIGNKAPLFHNGGDRPKCAANHEVRYLVVSKLKEEFLWLCPEPGCMTGLPYEEPRWNRNQLAVSQPCARM